MMNKLSYEDVCLKIDSILEEKKDEVLNVPMLHSFYITDNEKYDPDNFSHEIEDDHNSKDWFSNHTKMCPVKLALARAISLEHFDEGKWRRLSGYADTMKDFFKKKMESENIYSIGI